MTTPKPHPHAAMITEWIKDTSRIVQMRLNDEHWADCSSLMWSPHNQYRFADSVTPTIRSSLTEEELMAIGGSDASTIVRRTIADAAAERAIEDIPKLKVRIDKGELFRMYSDFAGGPRASLIAVAKAVVEDCNEQLRKPK